MLGHTISVAGKGLLPLGMEALIVIFAFNIFAYIVFGSKVEGMADFITTFETSLAMTLGKAYFFDLTHADRILGTIVLLLICTHHAVLFAEHVYGSYHGYLR